MIFAAILAGGKGTRVGANVPKQFLDLGGKPILVQTVDVFVRSGMFDIIYISVNEMWLEHTKELMGKYFTDEQQSMFRYVCGGKERMLSFLNVISDIKQKWGVRKEDMVLSHDAVRPFVTEDILADCIQKTREHRVAMASIPSADTTYYSGREGYLTATYDRKKLFYAQTPHGCMMDLLDEVINSYSTEELLAMTGTSQLFVNKNIDVFISLGRPSNLKITTLEDIDFCEYIYKKKNEK